MEEWRAIPGSSFYEVSSLGRARRRGKTRLLKLRPVRDGYLAIHASEGGAKRNIMVHQAVCSAFHGPRPTPHHQAAHGDGDKGNNAADNLRWATVSENHLDKRQHGTSGSGASNGRAKLTQAAAEAIRNSTLPARDLASTFGVSRNQVWRIRTGKSWGDVTALRSEAQAEFGEAA
jgi:hypothetical protein